MFLNMGKLIMRFVFVLIAGSLLNYFYCMGLKVSMIIIVHIVERKLNGIKHRI